MYHAEIENKLCQGKEIFLAKPSLSVLPPKSIWVHTLPPEGGRVVLTVQSLFPLVGICHVKGRD